MIKDIIGNELNNYRNLIFDFECESDEDSEQGDDIDEHKDIDEDSLPVRKKMRGKGLNWSEYIRFDTCELIWIILFGMLWLISNIVSCG